MCTHPLNTTHGHIAEKNKSCSTAWTGPKQIISARQGSKEINNIKNGTSTALPVSVSSGFVAFHKHGVKIQDYMITRDIITTVAL